MICVVILVYPALVLVHKKNCGSVGRHDKNTYLAICGSVLGDGVRIVNPARVNSALFCCSVTFAGLVGEPRGPAR